MMKKVIKGFLLILAVFCVTVAALFLALKYEMSWKLTDVGLERSPDGRYSVLFQAVGEADFPFGCSHARVTVYDGKKELTSFREDIADDGAAFRPDNYRVEWMPYGLVITFMGSEQGDREREIFFDGRDSFAGYTDEEIESILKDRYHIQKVDKITWDNSGYSIKADGIVFRADKHMALHDSYPQEVFKAVTDGLFPEKIQRSLEWDTKEGEKPSDLIYMPIICMNGPGSQDINPYCDDICEWLDACFERLPYDEAKDMYDATGFITASPGYGNMKFRFDAGTLRLDLYSKDKVGFYNDLYRCIVRYLNGEYDVFDTLQSDGENVDQIEGSDDPANTAESVSPGLTDETIKQWAAYDFDIAYDFPDGREYALIPVERALGSSFYVLMAFNGKGDPDSAQLINSDPFNQHGGEATYITFLDDGNTGFASLSYAGGSEALLFETFDGGKSYREIILPSPMIELPTGQFYNPFVILEEAWEESGTIYLKINQGPEGDHHSEALGGARTAGIYASKDKGKTFEFIREEAE